MTFLDMLRDASTRNNSMLCVGLDPEPTKFPAALRGDATKIYDFCAAIVDATADLVNSFKPQIAYFAAHGAEDQLEKLMAHMRKVAPHVPVILDAKRGDIGSTAEQYAKEAFERYGADAVTLSPFMGFDSITPYLKYEGKGAFLLCRTSNPGGDDLQAQTLADIPGQPRMFEHVAKLAQGPWNTNGQLGLVVGATRPHEIERVRAVAPTLPLLIPGVGAQGGDAVATVKAARIGGGPIIINSSRAVLYASQGDLVQAASLLQQAVRIDPYYASGYENLGDMYTLLANEAYNKAVSLDEMRTGLPAKLAMIQQIFPDGRTSIARTQQKAPAAASAQPASPAAAQPQQHSPHALSIAVEHAVKDWADAWASQNLARYFAAYSEQFKPLKGSLAAWKAERRARIEDKGFIKVDISDLKVQIQGNRATATFRQRYTADNYQSNDRKTLELQREGDKWLITREFTSP